MEVGQTGKSAGFQFECGCGEKILKMEKTTAAIIGSFVLFSPYCQI